MKDIILSGKEVKTIQVNNKEKLVTVVSKDHEAMAYNGINKVINLFREEEGKKPLEFEPREEKVVTISKPNANDEFDPYVGVALALAYNLFGSKTKFRKFVKHEILKEPKEKNKKLPSFKELDEKYTLQQLRDKAKANKIKGYTRLTKAELIKELYGLL